MTFDPRERVIIDHLGEVLAVDMTQVRRDTPLDAFGVQPQDWIVIAAALDEALPASAPHLRDAQVAEFSTVGDLIEGLQPQVTAAQEGRR